MTTLAPHHTQELSRASGLALDAFRPEHVSGRIDWALRRNELGSIPELVSLIAGDPRARTDFRRSVAISVTGYFRDPEQFELLEQHLAPLAAVRVPRVWSVGCSDGSEVWTVAAVLERHGLAGRSQLLGSDLLEENISKARDSLEVALSGEIALPDAHPRFEVRDVIREEPPGRAWDLVICRNLAIYLAPDLRLALHRMLTSVLAAGGLLLLGRSERLADPRALGVERVGPHLYRRVT